MKVFGILPLLWVLVGCQPAESTQQVNQPAFDPELVGAAVSRFAGVKEGSVVADIGSGQGDYTLALARIVGSKGMVYAVDIDSQAIEVLRKRVSERGLSQVKPILSKPDDPTLPPNHIDTIIVMNTYHHFTHPDEMLKGFLRALKSGGKVWILEEKRDRAQQRSKYAEIHGMPSQVIIDDAIRNGLRVDVHQDMGNAYFLLLAK